MLRKQEANTQTMWEKLGLADHRHFATLVERLSRLSKPIMPPPSWAPPGTKMLWPFVFVHVCEYSETLKDPKVGEAGIRCVLAGKLTKAEEVAVKDITLALVKHGWPPGTKGRCHMSIVVETVLKMRSAPVLEVASRQRAQQLKRQIIDDLCGLAARGLSPKLCWWSCSEVISMIQEVRKLLGQAQTVNDNVNNAICGFRKIQAALSTEVVEMQEQAPKMPCGSSVGSISKGQLKLTWKDGLGAMKMPCGKCGKLIRRSNLSAHHCGDLRRAEPGFGKARRNVSTRGKGESVLGGVKRKR